MRIPAKLAAAFVLSVMGIVFSIPTQAATWLYEDSVVRLEKNGQKRRLVFVKPSSKMRRAGVKKGTVLFEGNAKANRRLAGYAKTFKAKCDPLDYFVEGSIDSANGRMILQGQVPIFARKGCSVRGYSEDSGASTLKLTSLDRSESYARREEGNSRYDDSRNENDRNESNSNSDRRESNEYARQNRNDERKRRQSSYESYDSSDRNDDRKRRTSEYDRDRYDSWRDDSSDADNVEEDRSWRDRVYERRYRSDWNDRWR
jgi:hypothetical protein